MSRIDSILKEINTAFIDKNLNQFKYAIKQLQNLELEVCEYGRSIWGPCLACEEKAAKENSDE